MFFPNLVVQVMLNLCLSTVLGFPLQPTLESHASGKDYIVLVDKAVTCGVSVLSRFGLSPDHQDVHHTFDNDAFKGFAASMSSRCLGALANMTDIMHVEEVRNVSVQDTVRTLAPWGLQRISSSSYLFGSPSQLVYNYTYSNAQLGAGVDVYIVDTGIYVDNQVFAGRARMGFSFQSDSSDLDGHGTHVSGTAAGNLFGVASGANLIGVKVLGDTGSGTTSDTIAGMDYVISQHSLRKADPGFVGSIMSMSWGIDGLSLAIQSAITSAIDAGIHVSIAAGNSAADACMSTPSALGGNNSAAVVVGSINQASQISSFSNTGSCVDLYAPGESVLSAWIGAPNVLNFLTGTSMACPHATGVMAYLMQNNPTLASSPVALKSTLIEMALSNIVTGVAMAGDSFLLLNNGMKQDNAGAAQLQKRQANRYR